jgi:hypothetical protein
MRGKRKRFDEKFRTCTDDFAAERHHTPGHEGRWALRDHGALACPREGWNMRRQARVRAAIVSASLIVAALILPAPAFAAQNSFLGSEGRDWHHPQNWSLQRVPNETDDVVIEERDARISHEDAVARSVTILDSGLVVENGRTLSLGAGVSTIQGGALGVSPGTTVDLGAVTNWDAGSVFVGSGGEINIGPEDVLNITGDVRSEDVGHWRNEGTINTSSPNGTVLEQTVTSIGDINVDRGTLALAGLVQESGVTEVDDGAILLGPVTLQGGTLKGSGTVTGDVINSGGTVRPGAATTSVLEIDGNYIQGPAGTLETEIAGLSGPNHDVLFVDGVASLEGTLAIVFVRDFAPSETDTVDVLLALGGVSGEFSSITGGDRSFGTYSPTYTVGLPGRVILRFTPARVSIADASVLPATSGKTLVSVPVSLDERHHVDVQVAFETLDVTATSGSDYAAKSGLLTIPAGATSATILIAIFGSTELEPNETFKVVITSVTNATIARGEATVKILNDVTPPVIASKKDVLVESKSSPVTVFYKPPAATDNVDGVVATTCLAKSGSSFFSGTTTVACTASDQSENVATSSFNVIVQSPTTIGAVSNPGNTDKVLTTVTPGRRVRVTAGGFAPSSTVALTWVRPDGAAIDLGTTTAASDGRIDVKPKVPDSAPDGPSQMTAIGTADSGAEFVRAWALDVRAD